MPQTSLKEQVKKLAIKGINATGISSKYIGSPKGILATKQWIERYGKKFGAEYNYMSPAEHIQEQPPVTLEPEVHKIFSDEYEHESNACFIATIPGGRVWGRNGTVITPNDFLLSDVSREFGAYGGIMGKPHSVNRQIYLHKCTKVNGRVAAVGTAGTYNYHHWLYDTLPRIQLLKKAELFDSIDHFVMDYTGVSFQKESLQALGVPEEKIICANNDWRFHIEAGQLIVPSLPARLGTVGKWTVDFLRNTFLKNNNNIPQRLYISRRKATSRKLANEKEVFDFLQDKGFTEFFPEDHSIADTASYFANADYIVGVHGSGFANFAFLSEGARVIDIVAPMHLDPYYWMLTNRNGGHYGYIFGKGQRAGQHVDLVAAKVDHDIYLDIIELENLFKIL